MVLTYVEERNVKRTSHAYFVLYILCDDYPVDLNCEY